MRPPAALLMADSVRCCSQRYWRPAPHHPRAAVGSSDAVRTIGANNDRPINVNLYGVTDARSFVNSRAQIRRAINQMLP